MRDLAGIFQFAGFIFLAASGCASYAQSEASVRKTSSVYQNVYLVNTFLVIVEDERGDGGSISLSDTTVDGEVGRDTEFLYISSDGLGLKFSYPLAGAKQGDNWRFRECEFSVAAETQYYAIENKDVSLQLIDSTCEGYQHISKFLYSPEKGLIAISFGETSSEDETFKLSQSFVFVGRGVGFGSIFSEKKNGIH